MNLIPGTKVPKHLRGYPARDTCSTPAGYPRPPPPEPCYVSGEFKLLFEENILNGLLASKFTFTKMLFLLFISCFRFP